MNVDMSIVVTGRGCLNIGAQVKSWENDFFGICFNGSD